MKLWEARYVKLWYSRCDDKEGANGVERVGEG